MKERLRGTRLLAILAPGNSVPSKASPAHTHACTESFKWIKGLYAIPHTSVNWNMVLQTEHCLLPVCGGHPGGQLSRIQCVGGQQTQPQRTPQLPVHKEQRTVTIH